MGTEARDITSCGPVQLLPAHDASITLQSIGAHRPSCIPKVEPQPSRQADFGGLVCSCPAAEARAPPRFGVAWLRHSGGSAQSKHSHYVSGPTRLDVRDIHLGRIVVA